MYSILRILFSLASVAAVVVMWRWSFFISISSIIIFFWSTCSFSSRCHRAMVGFSSSIVAICHLLICFLYMCLFHFCVPVWCAFLESNGSKTNAFINVLLLAIFMASRILRQRVGEKKSWRAWEWLCSMCASAYQTLTRSHPGVYVVLAAPTPPRRSCKIKARTREHELMICVYLSACHLHLLHLPFSKFIIIVYTAL